MTDFPHLLTTKTTQYCNPTERISMKTNDNSFSIFMKVTKWQNETSELLKTQYEYYNKKNQLFVCKYCNKKIVGLLIVNIYLEPTMFSAQLIFLLFFIWKIYFFDLNFFITLNRVDSIPKMEEEIMCILCDINYFTNFKIKRWINLKPISYQH